MQRAFRRRKAQKALEEKKEMERISRQISVNFGVLFTIIKMQRTFRRNRKAKLQKEADSKGITVE